MSGKMQSFNDLQSRYILYIMLLSDASSVLQSKLYAKLQFVPQRENTPSPLMLYREIVSRPIYCECDIKHKNMLCDKTLIFFKLQLVVNTVISWPQIFKGRFLLWLSSPDGPRPPHFLGSTITLRHTTLGRTPLDE
jgi:hypothetical protein